MAHLYDAATTRRTSKAEGQFLDAWDFMKRPSREKDCWLDEPRPACDKSLEPSRIIYICDPGPGLSRIQNRVMLVIRASLSSYTCLTFCLHHESAIPRHHWRASTAHRTDSTQENVLNIVLQPELSDHAGFVTEQLEAREGMTINVEDVWNIESKQPIQLLGRVSHDSFQALLVGHRQVYVDSLPIDVQSTNDKSKSVEENVAGSANPLSRQDSRNGAGTGRDRKEKKKTVYIMKR